MADQESFFDLFFFSLFRPLNVPWQVLNYQLVASGLKKQQTRSVSLLITLVICMLRYVMCIHISLFMCQIERQSS
jgi:hypothetical protein